MIDTITFEVTAEQVGERLIFSAGHIAKEPLPSTGRRMKCVGFNDQEMGKLTDFVRELLADLQALQDRDVRAEDAGEEYASRRDTL